LLLGGVIAFWIWPLCRDLSHLEKTVSNVKPDGSMVQNNIQICIEDDGVRIPHAMGEKNFSPFCRLDESRDRQKGGAGLGLAIVKRIVDWHQGDYFVTDGELGGAKFIITLPNSF
jgi:two-component system OmpR family sensor kinase